MYFDYRVEALYKQMTVHNLEEIADTARKDIFRWQRDVHGERNKLLNTFTFFLIDADRMQPEELRGLIVEPEKHTHSREAGYGIYLFLSGSRSVEAWRDPVNSEHATLKDNQFFIRVFRSYQLARFVSLAPDIDVAGGPEVDYAALLSTMRRVIRRYDQSPTPKTMEQLRKDIYDDSLKLLHIADERRLEGARRKRAEYGTMVEGAEGSESPAPDPASDLVSFLDTLSFVFQVGRRPHEEIVEKNVKGTSTGWLAEYQGSFAPERRINAMLREEDSIDTSRLDTLVDNLQAVRLYRAYRDLARWLAAGAQHWAEVAGGVKTLIIDQTLADSDANKRAADGGEYRERLIQMTKAFRDMGPFIVDCVADDNDVGVVENLRRYLEKGEQLLVQPVSTASRQEHWLDEGDLLKYHMILIDVQFAGDYLGPAIVQDLANHLDRLFDPHVSRDNRRDNRPVIIVASHTIHTDVIQQCLNFGAEYYMDKRRLYALPARMAQARLPRRFAEPRGRKSNFRLLYQLQAWDVVKLQTEIITGEGEDALDRRWLSAVPKAELHTHIGTCISLPAIAALAFNTVGYLMDETCKRDELWEGVAVVIKRVCKVVIVAGALGAAATRDRKRDSAPDLLTRAAEIVARIENEGRASDETKAARGQSAYVSLVRSLTKPDGPVAYFELQSLLVAALCEVGGIHRQDEQRDQSYAAVDKMWQYFDGLQKWAGEDKAAQIQDVFDSVLQQCQNITGPAWHRASTEGAAVRNFPGSDSWRSCYQEATGRVRATKRILWEGFADALHELKGAVRNDASGAVPDDVARLHEWESWPPSPEELRVPCLADLVQIPEPGDVADRNLARYLWGSDLLGAEHLQYPENILLAAKDIVDQLACENVAYSEIRCAPTGYQSGGMSVVQATELLRSAFDLAAIYAARTPPDEARRRWVRVNILLTAKRNKPEGFQEIAYLLAHYLQRRDRYETDDLVAEAIAPRWWSRSRVVGFDLAGDETVPSERLEPLIEPLHKLSAPITIHAGEAATAENIWRAVYRFGARRIGHGLRLREHRTLMDYCVTEGICVEMCPISNEFTNNFVPVYRRQDYNGRAHWQHPLRYCLEEGLDVCISTDNRQLHHGNTLVDDYLRAAKLVGGLTRWEILRIVKAGFKHAFLQKSEVELMLSSMEDELYDLIVSSEQTPLEASQWSHKIGSG